MTARLQCFTLLLATWLLLTWSLFWQDALAGVFFSLVICALVSRLSSGRVFAFLHPRRIFWALVYVPYFLGYCVRANLDVAYRVLHPDTPIRPGFVRVTTALPSQAARVILASSITLTPGTLTVELDGSDLYIHWICVAGRDTEEYTRRVASHFERILMEVFR